MNLFFFLTIVQGIVAAVLVGTILMQRSEGGGLGIGGSPSGMMSARGAADFLSRATKWLAVLFVVLSITLAALAVKEAGGDEITSTLDRNVTSENSDPLFGPATTTAADEAVPAAEGNAAPEGDSAPATPAE